MSASSRRDRARRGRDVPRTARGGTATRPAAAADAITRLLEPVVEAAGYDLEDVTITPAGKRSLLRVVVDSDEGVSLDDVATVSRTVSAALDESDAMGAGPYVLEVTSPGVDRPLTEPRHWRRATGRLVRAPLAGGGQIEGRVVSADDEAVVIDTAADAANDTARRRGAGTGPADAPGLRRVGLDELGRGRVLVEFRRDDAAGPGTDED
ncbi:MAG TPA: ribosome maturation factor RimP [Streptosporangiaceae bacterium]|nr:ribosome maturation factor RimP [Streptosporangiaceae bacterium]